MEVCEIVSEFIRLDALLKYANVVGSGGEAKICIGEGKAKVNGETCTQRGKKLYDGDTVSFGPHTIAIRRAVVCD